MAPSQPAKDRAWEQDWHFTAQVLPCFSRLLCHAFDTLGVQGMFVNSLGAFFCWMSQKNLKNCFVCCPLLWLLSQCHRNERKDPKILVTFQQEPPCILNAALHLVTCAKPAQMHGCGAPKIWSLPTMLHTRTWNSQKKLSEPHAWTAPQKKWEQKLHPEKTKMETARIPAKTTWGVQCQKGTGLHPRNGTAHPAV